ncbi:MAG: TrmH family RNA methyltransferase [Eubacteriales bacterium]
MPLLIRKNDGVITARSNPLVVRVGKLAEKKYREAERRFRLDGIKLFFEALAFGAEIEAVLVREDAYDFVMKSADEFFGDRKIECGGTLYTLGTSAFEKLTSEKSPEGVICVAKYIDKFHKIDKIGKDEPDFTGKVLMLESLRDPGNLGTILRGAAAFGIETVVLSSDCADIYSPKTLRAAMGAVFKVRTVRTDDFTAAIASLRSGGRRVFSAALDHSAKKLGSFELERTDVFVIGNEGHGLSEEAVGACECSVFIPICENTESLNAAMAASVCMWELSKC